MEDTDHIWIDVHQPIGDDVVREVEEKLGIIFPADFVSCAKTHQGGRPVANTFDYYHENGQL